MPRVCYTPLACVRARTAARCLLLHTRGWFIVYDARACALRAFLMVYRHWFLHTTALPPAGSYRGLLYFRSCPAVHALPAVHRRSPFGCFAAFAVCSLPRATPPLQFSPFWLAACCFTYAACAGSTCWFVYRFCCCCGYLPFYTLRFAQRVHSRFAPHHLSCRSALRFFVYFYTRLRLFPAFHTLRCRSGSTRRFNTHGTAHALRAPAYAFCCAATLLPVRAASAYHNLPVLDYARTTAACTGCGRRSNLPPSLPRQRLYTRQRAACCCALRRSWAFLRAFFSPLFSTRRRAFCRAQRARCRSFTAACAALHFTARRAVIAARWRRAPARARAAPFLPHACHFTVCLPRPYATRRLCCCAYARRLLRARAVCGSAFASLLCITAPPACHRRARDAFTLLNA